MFSHLEILVFLFSAGKDKWFAFSFFSLCASVTESFKSGSPLSIPGNSSIRYSKSKFQIADVV